MTAHNSRWAADPFGGCQQQSSPEENTGGRGNTSASRQPELAFARYCYYQYCMLNGKAGGQKKNLVLRNVDCKIQRGGGVNEGSVECQE